MFIQGSQLKPTRKSNRERSQQHSRPLLNRCFFNNHFNSFKTLLFNTTLFKTTLFKTIIFKTLLALSLTVYFLQPNPALAKPGKGESPSEQETSLAQTHYDLFQRFADSSNAYYIEASRELAGTIYVKKDIKSLHKTVEKLISGENHVLANAVILANFSKVLSELNSNHSPYFLKQLLDHDIWQSAHTLSERIFERGNLYTRSRAHYYLGQYFFDRGVVNETFKHLSAIEESKALTPKQRDYATLMFGISLQKIKKHRDAVKVYEKVPSDSHYYSYAQLNIAVAYIRQGWWTDAKIAIDKALEIETKNNDIEEMNNRLLVVLGYSQLQNEFYRDARKTFRRVSLESTYVNRALLGLGLCALAQRDYEGAVNAFERLRQRPGNSLPVLEASLMVPYSLDSMGALDEAAINYSEAIAFFENKLRNLQEEKNALKFSDGTRLKEVWVNQSSPLIKRYYAYFDKFELDRVSAQLRNQILSLKKEFREEIVAQAITRNASQYNSVRSYLSQSQYGLAKLYDTQQ